MTSKVNASVEPAPVYLADSKMTYTAALVQQLNAEWELLRTEWEAAHDVGVGAEVAEEALAGVLWLSLRMAAASMMAYTHVSLWEKVWGGAFAAGVHSCRWRDAAARRAGIPEAAMYMYGDCPSLSVTGTLPDGVIVNTAELNEWLEYTAWKHVNAAGGDIVTARRLKKSEHPRNEHDRVVTTSGTVTVNEKEWLLEIRERVSVLNGLGLLPSSVVKEKWAHTKDSLRRACARAWKHILAAVHPRTLLVLDGDGAGWVHDQYLTITPAVDLPLGRSHPCCHFPSPLLSFPTLTLALLVTESDTRGHKNEARAMLCMHSVIVGGVQRALLASHKTKPGLEGHMSPCGQLGPDWHDGTGEGLATVVEEHMTWLRGRVGDERCISMTDVLCGCSMSSKLAYHCFEDCHPTMRVACATRLLKASTSDRQSTARTPKQKRGVVDARGGDGSPPRTRTRSMLAADVQVRELRGRTLFT